jgi:hypothetical protein
VVDGPPEPGHVHEDCVTTIRHFMTTGQGTLSREDEPACSRPGHDLLPVCPPPARRPVVRCDHPPVVGVPGATSATCFVTHLGREHLRLRSAALPEPASDDELS